MSAPVAPAAAQRLSAGQLQFVGHALGTQCPLLAHSSSAPQLVAVHAGTHARTGGQLATDRLETQIPLPQLASSVQGAIVGGLQTGPTPEPVYGFSRHSGVKPEQSASLTHGVPTADSPGQYPGSGP